MALDVTGLNPLQADGGAMSFDLAGLTPLDASGLVDDDQDSWLDLGRRYFENVGPRVRALGGSLMQTIGEATPGMKTSAFPERFDANSPELAAKGREIREAAMADMQANAPNVEQGSLKDYGYQIANAVTDMVPSLAVSFATRSPAAGAAVMGGQVYGQQYAEARDEGASPEKAAEDARALSAIEALTERIPLGVLTKEGGKFFSRTLKSMGAEGIQEGVNEAIQTGYDARKLQEKEGIPFAEAWERVGGWNRVKTAGIVGAGAGGSVAVVTQPLVREAPKVEVSPEVAATLTQDDIDSPIPNDLILEGRQLTKDAMERKPLPDGAVSADVLFGAEPRPVPEASPDERARPAEEVLPTPRPAQPLPVEAAPPPPVSGPPPETVAPIPAASENAPPSAAQPAAVVQPGALDVTGLARLDPQPSPEMVNAVARQIDQRAALPASRQEITPAPSNISAVSSESPPKEISTPGPDEPTTQRAQASVLRSVLAGRRSTREVATGNIAWMLREGLARESENGEFVLTDTGLARLANLDNAMGSQRLTEEAATSPAATPQQIKNLNLKLPKGYRLAGEGDAAVLSKDGVPLRRIGKDVRSLETEVRRLLTDDPKGTFKPIAGERGIDAATFLADRGGIRDDEGHNLLRARNLQKRTARGNLIRPEGMSIDAAGEALWDAGYFGPVETTPRPTENQVLEFIERAQRGNVYLSEQQAAADADASLADDGEMRARDDVRATIKDLGLILSESDIRDVLAIMSEQNIDAESALDTYAERQSIQAAAEYQGETDGDIPFEGLETRPREAQSADGSHREGPGREAQREGESTQGAEDLGRVGQEKKLNVEGLKPANNSRKAKITIRPLEVNDSRSGELFGYKELQADGVPVAAADVNILGDDVVIQNIVTRPAERRKGYASRLVDSLRAEFPTKRLMVSSMTDDGAAFFRKKFNVSDDGALSDKADGNPSRGTLVDVPTRFDGQPFPQARLNAQEWARKNIKGKHRNAATGWDIEVTTAGIKEATSHTRSYRDLDVVASLPDLIRTAVLERSEPPKAREQSLKAMHIMTAPFRHKGTDYDVTLFVREFKDGRRFYDQFSEPKRKDPGVVSAVLQAEPVEQSAPPPGPDPTMGPEPREGKPEERGFINLFGPRDPAASGEMFRRDVQAAKLFATQPLDRAMRLPFDVFGGVDEKGEWQPGRMLFDKARNAIVKARFEEDGRFGFVNGFLDRARAGLLDRYGLDDTYVARERKRTLDERKILAKVPELLETLKSKDIGTQEAKMLQAVLTGEDVGSAEMQQLAEPIRRAIDDLGAEAVQLGLLDADAFERNRGKYLHRVYLKHEAEQNALAGFMSRMAGSRRKKIIGDQFKGRGMFLEASPGNVVRNSDEARTALDANKELKALDARRADLLRRREIAEVRSEERSDESKANMTRRMDVREAAEVDQGDLLGGRKTRPTSFQKGQVREQGVSLNRLLAKSERARLAVQKIDGQLAKIEDQWVREWGRLIETAGVKPKEGQKYDVYDNVVDGKMRGRVYVPAGETPPKSVTGWRERGTWEVRGAKRGKIILWRDYTKQEREQMGEIMDARYTIAKTYMLMAHDLATGRFYKDISQNADWTSDNEPVGEWKDAGEYSRFWADPKVKWVRVPDALISKSNTKRYGALAGKYVRAEIWRDISELESLNKPGVWDSVLRQWKLNKTARNPVVHMNNVMSNLVLMDLADVRAVDLAAGVKSLVKRDAYYHEALENGALGSDVVAADLKENVLTPILDDLQRQAQGGQGTMQASFGTIGALADRIGTMTKRVDEKMLELYRMEDEAYRMALFIRLREKGFSAEMAADEARAQFLDYDIRAPWVNAARRTVLPFISYTYRAVPLLARAIATKPWKLAKYATIAWAANALGYALNDGDEDEERRSLRDEEQGTTWFGAPRMIRMPFGDDQGNPVFMDIRRWIPAGDIFDTNVGSLALPVPAPLQFGGPMMMAFEFMLNKQAFTGQEITNQYTDDFWDKAQKVSDWAWKSWAPAAPWVPGSWYWEKIENAAKGARDATGRPYDITSAIASSVGVKLKPQDVEQGMYFHSLEYDRIERELRAEMRSIAKDYDRGLLSEKAYNAKTEKIFQKMDRLNNRRAETFSGEAAE